MIERVSSRRSFGKQARTVALWQEPTLEVGRSGCGGSSSNTPKPPRSTYFFRFVEVLMGQNSPRAITLPSIGVNFEHAYWLTSRMWCRGVFNVSPAFLRCPTRSLPRVVVVAFGQKLHGGLSDAYWLGNAPSELGSSSLTLLDPEAARSQMKVQVRIKSGTRINGHQFRYSLSK